MDRLMDPLTQSMTVRRQMRLAVVARLRAKLPGVTVLSPGIWPMPPDKLPALLVSTGTDSKQSKNRGMAEFDTTIAVVVQGQLAAATAEDAQDDVEELAFRVENAILFGYWTTGMIQQWSSVMTEVEVSAEGSRHLAGFRMVFNAETFEAFDPTAEPPAASPWPPPDPATTAFDEVGLHADLANVFDPGGTYPAPPFPEAVKPAPRTSGPDGRDEGALDIKLPKQEAK